jgi:hypothetical protein
MAVSLVSTGITFPDNSTQTTAATGFGFKNRIINSAMVIDQRNAGASVTPTSGQYLVDRWKTALSQTGKYSVEQTIPGVSAPAGFTDYLGCTSLSAYSILSTDLFSITQPVEGFNTSDLNWGTSNAQTITLSFWVRSSLTGTFGGAIQNSAQDRSYPFNFSIPVANTWTQISITIAGDTTGTWVGATNGVGIRIFFSLGVGSTLSGTAGAWAGAGYYSATGAVSVVGTSGATFYITGVQLEKGSTATSFDYRPYGTELALCMRYYQTTFAQGTAPANGVTSGFEGGAFALNTGACWFQRYVFPVVMRAAPTITLYRGNEGSTDGAFATYDTAWTSLTTLTRQINTQGVHIEGSRTGAFVRLSAYLVSGNFVASAEL